MDIASAYKFLIIIILIIIILSLTSGLHFLIKDTDQSKKMVKSLTLRVALSVTLFIMIIFGFYMGWLTPNHI
jgi:branched-subunit amino acid transport protein AzlD